MADTTTQPTQRTLYSSQAAVAAAPMPRRRFRINSFRILVYTIVILGGIVFVMPFLWMVSTSFQSRGDISRGRFIPSIQFFSATRTTEAELTRTIQDYLDKDELPAYLEDARSQLETSQRQRGMTLREYLRTQRFGYAELNLNIDIPGLNQIWKVHSQYVVVGGVAHYIEAWDESNFSKYFANSLKIAALTILGQTITSILAAYAFARIEFPGRSLLFSIFLATIFIPVMVVMIPNRRVVTNIHNFFTKDFPVKQDEWGITDARKAIGDPLYDLVDAVGLEDVLGGLFKVDGPIVWAWMDSWPSLVVPFLASTFSIFLLRQFFLQIPDDLWDAARIDGAGHFRFLFQVVLPISRAAVVTTVIFAFIGTWNALEWPLLVTFTDRWRPISYGLYAFQNESGQNLMLLMAASVITLIPVLLVYLFAQKQFTEGIATSGLKG